ncbi:hypothetical protein [Lentzea sp. NPDC059081]|uniref:hypothetical protein n=1 Tax=Lentzea sp. NPDC059081 TaxID=3346719 RepID=UPI0036910210
MNDIDADGLLLRDSDLYIITNFFNPEGEVCVLKASNDYSKANVRRRISGQGMDLPPMAAFDGDDLLVVNSQNQIAELNLPFTAIRAKI